MKHLTSLTLVVLMLIACSIAYRPGVKAQSDKALKSTETITAAASCGSVCLQNLNTCKAACGGDTACLAQCQSEYECCQIQCHGGSCRKAATVAGKQPGK